MPANAQSNKATTPEQRRRMGMTPKPVFTTNMATEEIRHKFRLKLSMFFALMVASGIGSMWLVAYEHPKVSTETQWFFLGASIVHFSATWLLRKAATWSQALALILGLCTAGVTVGLSTPEAADGLAFLINPSLIIGVPLGGLVINLIFTKKERTQFVYFLFTLPWLFAAIAIVWFYPAGETAMAVSGIISLLLILMVLIAGTEAQPIYRPDEATKAAVDALPLAFSSFLNQN